jgi:hypothetical protein
VVGIARVRFARRRAAPAVGSRVSTVVVQSPRHRRARSGIRPSVAPSSPALHRKCATTRGVWSDPRVRRTLTRAHCENRAENAGDCTQNARMSQRQQRATGGNQQTRTATSERAGRAARREASGPLLSRTPAESDDISHPEMARAGLPAARLRTSAISTRALRERCGWRPGVDHANQRDRLNQGSDPVKLLRARRRQHAERARFVLLHNQLRLTGIHEGRKSLAFQGLNGSFLCYLRVLSVPTACATLSASRSHLMAARATVDSGLDVGTPRYQIP